MTTISGGGGTGGGGSGGGSDFAVSEGLSTQPVDTMPEARVIGTTKIIADKNANAIIVMGSADVKPKVFRLLENPLSTESIPTPRSHTPSCTKQSR